MRCPDCNKFVSMETAEPEASDDLSVENLDGGKASITGSYYIDRNCADCGTTLKQGTVEFDEEVTLDEGEVGAHDDHAFTLDNESASLTESGGGRYAKNMIGAEVTGDIICETCDDKKVGSFGLTSELAASEFEEQV